MHSPTRWEQALIGTALAHPIEASSVTDVRPQDFSCRSHQVLWSIVIELERGQRLSYQAVIEKLHAQKEIGNTGADVEGGEITGEMYLEELLSRRAPESIREFADNVIGASVKREMKILGSLIALDAESEKEIDTLLDAIEEKVYALRRKTVDTGADIGTLLGQFEDRMDAWRRGEITPAFTFHTPGLRRLIPFLEDTDFMLIAGRPGEGKSSVLRNEAFQAAMEGKKIVIFNLENSEAEYARYLVAHAAEIDTWKLRQPDLMTPEEVARAREAVRTLKGLPLRIVSLGAPSVYEIIRIARKLLLEGYQIVIVDYVQLIKNGIENEVQDLTMTSSLLRGFSLTHHIPVIAAAQLNREIVRRANGAKPQLSDLRGSGCLTGDTLVQLADGSRAAIASLVGLQPPIVALDEADWKLKVTRARKVWKTGTKPVYRMSMRYGANIRSTENHKFLTICGWKAISDLRPGERIALPRTLAACLGTQRMPPDQAALLGHLIGDGCTLPGHITQYTTREAGLAEVVCELASRIFGDQIAPRINREHNWFQVYLPSTTPAYSGHKSALRGWLENLGVFGLRSHEKHVPHALFTQPDEILATFLRHLWVTDGSLGVIGQKSPRPIAYYATSSHRLAEDVQYLLLRLGILSRVARVSQGDKGRDQWHVIVTGKRHLSTFLNTVGTLDARREKEMDIRRHIENRNANPNHDVVPSGVWQSMIHPERYKAAISLRDLNALLNVNWGGSKRKECLSREWVGHIGKAINSTSLCALAESDVFWDEIVDITYDGVEDVYDMEVENLHNFIANNIIAHNSLEQDALIVAFNVLADADEAALRRFPQNTANGDFVVRAVPMRIYVEKNRNGPTDKTPPMLWDKATNRFYALAVEEPAPARRSRRAQ